MLDPDTIAALAHVADALEAEQRRVDACAGPAPGAEAASEGRSFPLLDRRLRSFEHLGPYVAERTLASAVSIVGWLARDRETCGMRDAAEPLVVHALPPTPACVAGHAERDVEAANHLAAWGYPEAAAAIADAATRWVDADCPRRVPTPDAYGTVTSHEPTLCDCGGKPTPPASLFGGYRAAPGSDTVSEALELTRWTGSCVVSLDDPSGTCPTHCRALRWARVGSWRARLVKRGPLPTYEAREPGVWFAWEDPGALRRGAAAALAAVASTCTEGAAEWLGDWVARDDRPGSACLAELAATRLTVDRWVVVERW